MSLREQADAIEHVVAPGGQSHTRTQGTRVPPSCQGAGGSRLPDGVTAPVPADDSRAQAGQVFEQIQVDGVTFHRRREGVFPSWPDSMRLRANRPLTDAEKRRFAGPVGYAYRATVAGEPLGEPASDTPYSFVVSADITKSSRDDEGMALEAFEEVLTGYIQKGSPVRKTDRSGTSTKGTRLVEGFNDPDLKFELYYDDVCQ